MALTFSRVKIDQTSSAGVTVLKAGVTGQVVRLHSLIGTMAAAGTLTIEDSSTADLSGPMPLAANGGLVLPFQVYKHSCLAAGKGRGLQINTSQKFYGWAVVSSATS